jgi:hypothetical protein
MTEAKVLSHERFKAIPPATPEGVVARLREDGLVDDKITNLEDLDLPEPVHTEQIIGTLTDTERQLYRVMFNAMETRQRFERMYQGEFLQRLGKAVQTSDEAVADVMASQQDGVHLGEVKSYFRQVRLVEYTRQALYWSIAERLDAHDWLLSVRSKERIVKIKRQW